MTGFIGVHVGAGNHSEKLQPQYEKVCKKACKKALDEMKRGKSAVEAVAIATATLEDFPLTNAGTGSSLTWEGCVECDASLMDGDKLGFGAVGAVRRIRNPIKLAKNLCLAQYEKLSLGRVQPCLLVAEGAEKWAVEKGMELVEPNSLITSKSLSTFKKYKRRAEAADSKDRVSGRLLDTVGAVAVDLSGRVAAACSSGGIVLKHPGRVGQAGMWGCGCWAENQQGGGSRGVAVSASGCGEDLIRTSLARATSISVLASSNPTHAINNSLHAFLNSPYLGTDSQRLCGVIAVDVESSGRGEFAWAHTSSSMAIGYMACGDSYPHCRVSRLPCGVPPGTTVIIEGVPF